MSRFRRIVDNAIKAQHVLLVPEPLESIRFKENCRRFIESATDEQINSLFIEKTLKEDLASGRIRRNTVALIREVYKGFLDKFFMRVDISSKNKALLKNDKLNLYYTFLPFKLKNIVDDLYVVYLPKKGTNLLDDNIKAAFNVSKGDVFVLLRVYEGEFLTNGDILSIINGNYDDEIDHEITHDLQFINRGRTNPGNSAQEADMKAYYNNQDEYQAFSDRIIDKVDALDNKILRQMSDDYLKDHKELDSDFLLSVIKYCLANTKEDLRIVYNEFLSHITPEKTKELYSEVSQVIDNKLFYQKP